MRNPKTLLFVFGLFAHTSLTEHVETTQQGHKPDGSDKKISKREYYAPEYNHEKYSYPAYRFEYGVHDPQSGDIKKQYEERDGDQVRGYYSLMEPDGAIRLVEYTADSKNGFQAVVKRFGQSQHPTVTHHMNTAGDGGSGEGYAPSYHSGEHQYQGSRDRQQQQQQLQQLQQHHREPPAHYREPPAHHYEPPAQHYEPPAQHYEPPVQHYEPPAQHYEPPAYHYEPPAHHYEAPVPAYDHYQHGPPPPPLVPAYDHYQHGPPVPVRPSHYRPAAVHRPEVSGFDEHGPAPQPLFAASLEPTVHGDYGSASPDQYHPAPLQFPVENGFWHGIKGGDDDDGGGGDGVHRVGLDEYQYPAADDGNDEQPQRYAGNDESQRYASDDEGESQRYAGDGEDESEGNGAAATRPEYLRKYFEPDYRGNDASVDRGEEAEEEEESK